MRLNIAVNGLDEFLLYSQLPRSELFPVGVAHTSQLTTIYKAPPSTPTLHRTSIARYLRYRYPMAFSLVAYYIFILASQVSMINRCSPSLFPASSLFILSDLDILALNAACRCQRHLPSNGNICFTMLFMREVQFIGHQHHYSTRSLLYSMYHPLSYISIFILHPSHYIAQNIRV